MGDNVQHRWILEFLLRQPTEDHALNRLIIALSPLVPDHRLVKTLLMRRISSEIKNGLISEKILESLELIEEIDHLDNIRSLDSMKDAYCAVALDCVVRFLKENPKNFPEYTEAVDRIWRGRVLAMEKGEDVSLVSEWTKGLRTQLEEAVHDVGVCNYISSEDTKGDALKAVGVFLSKVFEELGPPFLEVAAKIMSREGEDDQSLINISVANHVQVNQECSFHDQRNELDENRRDVFGNSESRVDTNPVLGSTGVTSEKFNSMQTPECGGVCEDGNELCPESGRSPLEPSPETANMDAGPVQDPSKFSLEEQVEVRQETSGDALCMNNMPGGMMDVDCGLEPTPEPVNEIDDEVQVLSKNLAALGPSHEALAGHAVINHGKVDAGCSVKCNEVLTPEFTRLKEALQSSITDLKDVVTDPLPDALCMAATVSAKMAKEVVSNVQSADIQAEVDIDRHVQSAAAQNEVHTGRCDHSGGEGSENVQSKEGNVRNSTPESQPSLMTQNSSAQNSERVDEIESESDENPVRPRLPTPDNRTVSPLRKEEIRNVAGRRRKKFWSSFEEDSLRDAVKEFGRGNWKSIIEKYHHIFTDRTPVDLKDKWRNMTK